MGLKQYRGGKWVDVAGGGGSAIRTVETHIASRTLTTADAGKIVEIDAATDQKIILPAHATEAIPVGSYFDLLRYGAGAVLVDPANGVTLHYPQGRQLVRYALARLVKRGADEWIVSGGLAGPSGSRVGGAFDPLLDISWHAVFWADELAFTDGASVAQWDDSSGNARHAKQGTATSQPTFYSALAELGGRPAVRFDSDRLVTASFAGIFPFTVVVIGRVRATGTNAPFVSSTWDTALGTPPGLIRQLTNAWSIYNASTSISGGTSNINAHLFIGNFVLGADSLEVDGVVAASGEAGDASATGVQIGAFSTELGAVDLAFVGMFNGTMTAKQKEDLLTWSRAHYGTP